MALSAIFAGRSGADIPPRFQYSGRDGSYKFVVSTRDSSGQFTPNVTPIPFGAKLISDFGRFDGGRMSFSPFDDSHLVPLPYSAADAEAAAGDRPGPDYVMVARLPVLLQHHGLAQWTIGGVIAQNEVARVRLLYENSAEAARGELPVIVLLPSKQVEIRARNNERHIAPQLDIIGWVPRSDDTFGPRIVPPPVPILPAGAAAPQLVANDDTPPWNEPAASAPATPEQAANDAARIADDVFSEMTPVAARKSRPEF
jgi:hypothetical protein